MLFLIVLLIGFLFLEAYELLIGKEKKENLGDVLCWQWKLMNYYFFYFVLFF